MRQLCFAAFALSVLVMPWAFAGAEESETASRFFFNDDGDRGVMLLRGPFHLRQLHYPVDNLLGTGVTTLVYCANVGSDQAYYPSRAASSLDWRMTESHRPNNPIPIFPRLYSVGQQLREEGVDVLGEVMRRAQEKGLEFVPSLRMNDGHFANNVHPTEHPLTGEFWMRHQDMTIGTADSSVGGHFQYLLNFEHQEVRDYRMAQITELIDGYAVSGFEMDFSRHYMFFAPGRQKPELITAMVRMARERLTEMNKSDGKKRFLIVRVAHTLARNAELGLDVPQWIREGLVDYVVPSSPDRIFQFDIPISEFLALTEGTPCRVVASPDSYGADGRIYRAGMANYYAMGQKDTYLFNFFTRNYPYTDEDFALLRDLKSLDTLWGRSKDFYAGAFFRDAMLPLDDIDLPYDVGLFVGDDLEACRQAGILKFARLVLEMSYLHPNDLFELSVNGEPLPVEAIRQDMNGFVCELRNGRLPHVGWNTVSVKVKSHGSDVRPRLKRVHLACDYNVLGGGYQYFVPRESLLGEQIVLLEAGRLYSVEMEVGEDLAACSLAGVLVSAELLVQMGNLGPADEIEFLLNDKPLANPATSFSDGITSFKFELRDGPYPRPGRNTVSVRATAFSSENRPCIPRIHLQTELDLSRHPNTLEPATKVGEG